MNLGAKIFALFTVLGGFLLVVGGAEFFELGPIHYSGSTPDNAASRLAQKPFQPADDRFTDLDFLKSVLSELDVPVESQLLVFSKTSAQKRRILPRFPRALYFSESCYVGYVPGGDIEVIAHDPKLGLVFYTISLAQQKSQRVYLVKRKQSCLSCHVSVRTRNVPGLFVRSVTTDDQGEVDVKGMSEDVDDQTPLAKRWGGWYVTGNWAGLSHRGNDFKGVSMLNKLEDLREKIEASRYLKDTSDIVGLLVFEHQCKMHTILVEAKMQFQRSLHLENALHIDGETAPAGTMSFKSARLSSEEIVEGLLFCGEADIGDGIEGNEEFTKVFQSKAKLAQSGKHLRKLRLYGRLFKYRCSYMIHSDAFAALPDIVKKLTYQRLYQILTAEEPEEKFAHLKQREKATILEILKETTPIQKHLKK